nr:MAG TPA: hypothetical protein [Caudoviricetes sp.]
MEKKRCLLRPIERIRFMDILIQQREQLMELVDLIKQIFLCMKHT